MTGKQKIRDRIRQLREMTSARGCTEAEALAAADKAAQLMRDHGLSEADIVMEEKRSGRAGMGKAIRAKLWPVIGGCTNTAVLITQDGTGATVAFIGVTPGPDIAVYLRDVCERALDRSIRDFKTGKFYRRRRGLASKRAAVADFADGFVNRLSRRLVETFSPVMDRDAYEAALVARDQRYEDSFEWKPTAAPLRHNEARAAGWIAGKDVTLAHGVGGSAAPLQIGGGS
ncbi:MAG: DUF2786 domain-containing protein [Rhizobiaceae bacterium]|nr:DUF2786 domain-containing protein [Rhizobiaceae bacterium]